MTPKLYKASDVCELAQVQPYVLRSWEKEFPGIGIQKSADSPRLYRQSDLDQVLRIKQLVFVEGLTVAGARRKIDGETPVTTSAARAEMAEVLDALGSEVRTTIATVRNGLRQIQSLLAKDAGEVTLPARAKNGTAVAKKKAAAPVRRSKAVVASALGRKASAKGKKRRANA